MLTNKPIYLDYHATTPVDPMVATKVMAFMTDQFGNASSVDHLVGDHVSKYLKKNLKELKIMSFISLDFGRQTMTPKQKEELREMYREAEKKEIDEIFSEQCPECGYQFGLPQGNHQEECPQCTWTPKSIEEFM